MDATTLREKLAAIDQKQVLHFYDQLDEPHRQQLRKQLLALDLGESDELAERHVRHKAPVQIPTNIEPVRAFPNRPGSDEEKRQYETARERGAQLLREGKVGAFLVAGGQGTRLGYDGPKGEFPVTPVRKKPLFQVFAEQLLAWSRDAGRSIPWYIMTSEVNDAPTREFFNKHKHFGYNASDVFFFQQGMMPAFDMASGDVLLDAKDSLALSPDGHGGSLQSSGVAE